MHIHYTDGPEILKDVSIEKSNFIFDLLSKGYSVEEAADEAEVSVDVVDEVRAIYSNKLKRCCFCGAVFDPGRTRRAKCFKDKHFLPCIDCGQLIEVKESYNDYIKAGGRRCPECRAKQIGATRRNKSSEEKAAITAKQEATMLERYGARNALQVPEIKAKADATIKERFGVDNLSQSKEIQAKIKKNSQEKFGVDHYTNAPEVRKRMHEGMVRKYGVEYALQNKELLEKTKQTNLERYGVENVFQNEQVREKFVKNHIATYGVAWPHQRPELIEQAKQTNRAKYGASMYPLSDDYLKDLSMTDSSLYNKLTSMETEVSEFIHTLNESIVIEKHNRTILDGKEIDLYLSEYELGIECNPTYTHNSSFKDPWGNDPKHYKYHFDKSKQAQEQGVFLLHIFGYEWTNRRSVICSQIQNLLGCNSTKIHGRETIICEVSPEEAVAFFDDNHRQGASQSKVRLGLRDKHSNQLVSLMTFGKMRPGIGKKIGQSDNEWELIRFCNLRNTSVIGGASKLFKHFIREYTPDKVVSFSDVAHTRGGLYKTLGFEYASLSDPGYVWVKLSDDSYLTRVSCQKQNLTKLFEDVTEETILSHTEPEIMMNHGYARVFDSGVIRWEWSNKNG